jgi:hypothetical protein
MSRNSSIPPTPSILYFAEGDTAQYWTQLRRCGFTPAQKGRWVGSARSVLRFGREVPPGHGLTFRECR